MRTILPLCALALVLSFICACNTAPSTEQKRDRLEEDSEAALQALRTRDPGIQKFFDSAVGYAVFPSVGKGAIGIGGAYGRGIVYSGRAMIGYSDLSQVTIGLQLGGQEYQEVVFFQTDKAFGDFKAGRLEFSANASAVAVKAGAATASDYQNGVAVFVMTKGGLMFEASIGGQSFGFQPKDA